MDVWIKVRFDVDRLKVARFTKELQYAALDCAVWSFHLIDWVLNAVDEATHIRLTGKRPRSKGSVEGFITTNNDSLPALRLCRQMANTGKHRVLTTSIDDPTWITNHTVRFSPPFDARAPHSPMTISALAYLRDTTTGQEVSAVEFFVAVASQWESFLKREKLFVWGWDDEASDAES